MGNVIREGEATCKTPLVEIEPGILECPKCGHKVDMNLPSRRND